MIQRLVVVNMRVFILFTHALPIFKGRSLFVLASTFAIRLKDLIYSIAFVLQARSFVSGDVELVETCGALNVWWFSIRVNKAIFDGQSRWQTDNAEAYRIGIDSIELLVNHNGGSESDGTCDYNNANHFKSLAHLFGWAGNLESKLWTLNLVVWILIVKISNWFGKFEYFKHHLYRSRCYTCNETVEGHCLKQDQINLF